MRKIKQIAARNASGYTMIDNPVNEFLATLPMRGDEVVDIKYSYDNRGNVYFAMVEYNVYEARAEKSDSISDERSWDMPSAPMSDVRDNGCWGI